MWGPFWAIGTNEKRPHARRGTDSWKLSRTISACEKGEQWQQASELFVRMLGEDVQRDTTTDKAAIKACENAGREV